MDDAQPVVPMLDGDDLKIAPVLILSEEVQARVACFPRLLLFEADPRRVR